MRALPRAVCCPRTEPVFPRLPPSSPSFVMQCVGPWLFPRSATKTPPRREIPPAVGMTPQEIGTTQPSFLERRNVIPHQVAHWCCALTGERGVEGGIGWGAGIRTPTT